MAGGIVLSVEPRGKVGTSGARAARRDQRVPGVLYGGGKGPEAVSVARKDLVKALRAGKFLSHMITLDSKGQRSTAIPKAIQFHPVTDEPLHFDLYRVDENAIIEVDVPVHFKNSEGSPGLKRGGALTIVDHMVRLKVPAGQIPEEIVVDLTGLEVGAVVHVANLELPPGVQLAVKDADHTIATISGRMAEGEAAAEGGDAATAS